MITGSKGLERECDDATNQTVGIVRICLFVDKCALAV